MFLPVSQGTALSPRLALYAQASAWCLEEDLSRAQAALAQAYAEVPPLTLTWDDRYALTSIVDDLVYVGQLLPSLQPTLELLRRFHGTCGHEVSQELLWSEGVSTTDG